MSSKPRTRSDDDPANAPGPRIEVDADSDRPGAFLVSIDGTPQSYVDVDDPTNLVFEYVRRIGHVVDLLRPTQSPITAVHLGGGGMTLPRYVASTRPGSSQQVIEADRALIDTVRDLIPLPRREPIRVRCADAARAAAILPRGLSGAVDVLVVDVFAGARTPASFTTGEFFDSLRPLLAPDSCVAVNIGDGPTLGFAKAMAATLSATFGKVAIAAEPAIVKGRRFGNLVLLAGAVPDGLARRLAGDPFPSSLLIGDAARRFVGGAKPITASIARDSPAPPPGLIG